MGNPRRRHQGRPHVRKRLNVRGNAPEYLAVRRFGLRQVRVFRPRQPQGDLGEAVGVLVFVGVLQSFVDHADAVFQRRLAQQQHDHPRPQGRRRIANDFLRHVDGRRHGCVRGVHLLGRAGGHRLGMALELLPEGRRAPCWKRLRHPSVEFVRGVLRVRAGGGVFAAGVERVADQQVAAHQAQLQ